MEARLREHSMELTHTYRAVTAVHAAETVKHVYPTACVILQAGVTRIEEPAQMPTGKQATALLKFARTVSLIFLMVCPALRIFEMPSYCFVIVE